MVVKSMRWPAWPPSPSRKLETFLAIRGVDGLPSRYGGETARALAVEVQWKGQQKGLALGSLRRSAKRNRTQERFAGEDGVARFETDGEFRNVCGFAGPKEGLFYPWEIAFTVHNAVPKVSKNKASVLGTASLDLTEYASVADGKEISVKIPINGPNYTPESRPSLDILISFVEIRAGQEIPGSVTESATTSPLTSCYSGTPSPSKDEVSALKAGLRKVMSFTDFMSRKGKKALSEEDGSDSGYPLDSDSPEESGPPMSIDRSVSYESLALANCAQGLNGGDESLIYYSHRRRSDECPSQMENPNPSVVEEVEKPSLKQRLLPWRKRKLNFRKSPKPKGEPLLKKHYGEEGGDDIDYDRRQLSSSEESSFWWNGSTPNRSSSISEFGDDGFVVGSWENKEVTSRDGLMKLQTQVFFSAIDQRSERAAGESACTALVAVISDWLQRNRHEMPVRSEFDDLIRDGSSEWRSLCDNSEYIAQFPDKHFDLETVLQAQVRPLAVVPEKSFIGFFRPEGLQEGELDFLHGAMSFDNIWDEISKSASELPSGNDVPMTVYIVSWNDHFFVLKVENDAYYIIDTLGERLFEGCNQAYVLKFDKDTKIQRVPRKEDKKTDSKETNDLRDGGEKEAEVVCVGKESCQEYIKSFLAAIPLRELQVDLSKGKMATSIHHRLQIEFHYTVPEKDVAEAPVKDAGAAVAPMALAVA